MKKTASVMLVLCLLLSLLPVGAFAATYYTITVKTVGDGSVMSASGSTNVAEDGNIGFTISPSKGNYTGYIAVDGIQQNVTDTYEFYDVTSDHTLVVGFFKLPATGTDGTGNSGSDNSGTGTGTTTPPPVVVPAMPFTDVSESDWFYSNVKYCYYNDLMKGVSDTSFAPNAEISRATVITVIWRMAGSPSVDVTNEFSDVSPDAWYAKAVSWAYAKGLVTGSGGKFGPDTSATREELALYLYRYASYKGTDVSDLNNLSAFTDKGDVSADALTAVQWAVAEKYLTGIDAQTLSPQGLTTRAQFAAVLSRFYKGN